jgi:CheY-like chemotaxis protein
LGLAIVHGIVLQNHSYIKIQSSVGVGTQVQIYFPLDVPVSSYKRDLAVTTTSEHQNILLIDDEDMVRYAVASQLKIIGNVVFEATDFQSAQKILERNTIGLILTDIRLGSETGLQLVDRIKKLGFHCPIIFMTGYFGGEHLKKYGDIPVLLKPFTTNQLKKALEQCKNDF